MYMIIYVCIVSFMRLSILFAKGGMHVLVMFRPDGVWRDLMAVSLEVFDSELDFFFLMLILNVGQIRRHRCFFGKSHFSSN